MNHYFILYKPYKMLSQFVRVPKKKCLSDLEFHFPEGANAVGRLDENSEGLLIISTDKQLTNLLLQPANQHKRIYWVQVHGKLGTAELESLAGGVLIRIDGRDYLTKPCEARVISEPLLSERSRRPVRKDLETEWIELILTEGKFHQVRKMCAAIGHQVLRLVRSGIEDVRIGNLQPGEVQEYSREQINSLLHLALPRQQGGFTDSK